MLDNYISSTYVKDIRERVLHIIKGIEDVEIIKIERDKNSMNLKYYFDNEWLYEFIYEGISIAKYGQQKLLDELKKPFEKILKKLNKYCEIYNIPQKYYDHLIHRNLYGIDLNNSCNLRYIAKQKNLGEIYELIFIVEYNEIQNYSEESCKTYIEKFFFKVDDILDVFKIDAKSELKKQI